MPSRLNIQDMRETAQLKGGKCLSKEYIDYFSPLKWMCKRGHTWDMSYGVIRQGAWCVQCERGERGKIALEEINEIAKSKGGKCLSNEYMNNRTRLTFQCSEGHTWTTEANIVKQGHWCRACSGYLKLTIEEFHAIAKRNGGECLSSEYKSSLTKLKFRCSEGHIWETAPGSLRKMESWCPYCAPNRKITIKILHEAAKSHGGKCLSAEYAGYYTKLQWQCSNGHTWFGKPSNIMAGYWCFQCAREKVADSRRSDISEFRAIAKKRGGKLLSKEYVSKVLPLHWQCGKGHKWFALPFQVKNKTWCPVCAGRTVNKHTIETVNAFAASRGGKCLSKKYIDQFSPLKWQCKKGHVWMASLKAAGKATWCAACNREERDNLALAKIKEAARSRGGKCLSEHYKNNRTRLTFECAAGHRWETTAFSVIQGNWCAECSGNMKHTIEDMHQLAQSLGGKCLSTEYINNKTNLKWECAEGHKWDARPNSIVSGQWCPVCGRKSAGEQLRLHISEFHKIAKKHGGRLLSKEYINGTAKMEWQCSKGHRWMAMPQSIKRGLWCAQCSGIAKGTIEKMQYEASLRGGKCLSEKYVNSNTKIKWQCSKGHTWMAEPSNVVNNFSWCPYCMDKTPGSIDEMNFIAAGYSGKCLSPAYKGKLAKLEWECKKGHRWKANPKARVLSESPHFGDSEISEM